MIELSRTVHSKLSAVGEDAYRAELCVAPMHVARDPEAWLRGDDSPLDDVDLTWEPDGATWRLRRAWYGLTVLTQTMGYRYVDRTTGARLSVTLEQVGDIPVPVLPPPRVVGAQIWWDDVVPGVDVYLDVRPASVEIFKRIRHAEAPRSFVWRLQESLPPRIGFSTMTRGRDQVQPVQLVYEVGPEDLRTVRGDRIWRVVETWTGRTIRRDPVTRKAQLSSAVVYPVLIDFNVSVAIAANADDGYERQTGYWDPYSCLINNTPSAQAYPGFRFRSLAIPQGATITLATFTYWVVSNSGAGAGGGATLKGWAHDSAPAWATNAGPTEMTATTAGVNIPFGAGTTLGSTAVDVAAIVQEIVNRAGWVSGNNLALGVKGSPLTGYYVNSIIYDHNTGTGSKIAKLDINFTAGGRTTKNTRGFPLGVNVGMGFGIGGV